MEKQTIEVLKEKIANETDLERLHYLVVILDRLLSDYLYTKESK